MGADGGETRRHPRPPPDRLAPSRGERWLDVGKLEEGELRLTAGSGEDMWHGFTSYDGMAKAHGSFSIVALVWRTGQTTRIHDHVT